MSFSKGDKVYVNCSGKCYGYDGTVIGQDAKGDYIVAFGWDTPEPQYEQFSEEDLVPSMSNLPDGKKAGDALRRFMVGTDALPDLNDVMKKMGEFMEESIIKDSGERTAFPTGAVRDMHEGKGDMLSVPWAAMLRVSRHYENGAKKYGRYNYLKGIPVSSFIDSALRHLAKYVAGYDDEDHLSATAFNVLGAIQMEEHCPEMMDIPWREGKRSFHYESENKTEERNSENV